MNEINRIKYNNDVMRMLFKNCGQGGTDGGNYGNEYAHNAKDVNASQCIIGLYPNRVIVANNGDFLSWKVFQTDYIYFKKKKKGKTGYWGLGGSKIAPYKDGVPDYQLASDGNKYFIRKWEWKGLPVKLTTKNVEDIEGCDIVEYEISEEKYRELCLINHDWKDSPNNLPNFLICVRRFEESTMIYDASKIVDNLNFCFMNVDNFVCTVYDNIISKKGNVLNTRKLYYPTLVKVKGSKIKKLPRHYSDLPCIEENWEFNGAYFNLYLTTQLQGGSDYEQLLRETNNGKDRLFLHTKFIGEGRGTNPRQILIDNAGVQLVLCDPWQKGLKELDGNDGFTRETFLVAVLVNGVFEASTIKTQPFSDEFQKRINRKHKELVDRDKSIQYIPTKLEDKKVDEVFKALTTEENTLMRSPLILSLGHLSNNELTPPKLMDSFNYSIRDFHGDGCKREYDFLVLDEGDSNGEYWNLHLEFQNNLLNREHTDGIFARICNHQAKQHVLVVDDYKGSQSPLKEIKVNLEKNKIKSTVWICKYKDLISGSIEEFKKIWELK